MIAQAQAASTGRRRRRTASSLPPDLARALTQAARWLRKHYSIPDRRQADRAGRLFARALYPRRAGRPKRHDVTRALQLEAQGVSRKEIYRLLDKRTRDAQHALREAMRLRRFRERRRSVSNSTADATPTNSDPVLVACPPAVASKA